MQVVPQLIHLLAGCRQGCFAVGFIDHRHAGSGIGGPERLLYPALVGFFGKHVVLGSPQNQGGDVQVSQCSPVIQLRQGFDRADPGTQPRHGHVRGQQVQRDEPRRRRDHEGGRDAARQEERADKVGDAELQARRDEIGHQGARERPERVREEREDEVLRPETRHRGGQALGRRHVRARRRRNELRPDHDERHVDGAADEDAGDDGEDVPEYGHRFSLRSAPGR